MRYFLILLLCLMWSCIPTYQLSRPQLIYNNSEGSRPELNKEFTADSGSVIYMKFKYKVNPAVELNQDLNTKYRDVHANVKLSKMNKDGDEVYGTVSISDRSITYLRDEDKDGKFDHILVQARKNSTNWTEISPPVSYRHVKGIRSESNGYEQEIIYEGKKGRTITVDYREYRGDLTRASSSRQIDLHLSNNDDNILTVNGARIKVLNATADELDYSVIRGFDSK